MAANITDHLRLFARLVVSFFGGFMIGEGVMPFEPVTILLGLLVLAFAFSVVLGDSI